MRAGGIFLVGAAVLCLTACLGEQGKLEVRSSSTGLKAGNEPVPFRIAEARGQLALGNVALALEGFRKAAREDPASVDALAGIALCYDQMGRFDLSRRNYEMALALAPRDPELLALLAGSLDKQGLSNEAASVRHEMAALAAPSPVTAEVAESSAPQVAAPVGQSVTIALPPLRPAGSTSSKPEAHALALAPVGHSVTIALPPPKPAPAVAPVKLATDRQPRLERLSLTEVALITGSGPRWKSAAVPLAQMAVRAMPPRPGEVRLLNAARVNKLAARTRAFLGRFGWREMALGDAATVRARSLILYPQGTRAAAGRLAVRLGFAMAERSDVRQVTILLGRDAASHPALRPKA